MKPERKMSRELAVWRRNCNRGEMVEDIAERRSIKAGGKLLMDLSRTASG